MNRSELLMALIEDMAAMRRVFGSLPIPTRTLRSLPTQAQIGILFFLEDKGPQTLTELSRGLWITSPAATQLVNGLVRQQLILRVQDPRDRRKIRLSLTSRGKKKLARAKTLYTSAIRDLFAPLTTEELSSYHALQQKMIRSQVPQK